MTKVHYKIIYDLLGDLFTLNVTQINVFIREDFFYFKSYSLFTYFTIRIGTESRTCEDDKCNYEIPSYHCDEIAQSMRSEKNI
jgi:hypothetical protein